MRSVGRVGVIACVAVAAALVVTVSAQKGKPKPAPVWTVEIEDTTDGTAPANVFLPNGKLTTGGGVLVDASYHGEKGDCQCSTFSVTITGSMDTASSPWIGFRGLQNVSNTIYGEQSCAYPPFDAGGILQYVLYTPVLLPDSTVPNDLRSCITGFLGTSQEGHKHPQYPYNKALFSISLANLDLNSLALDQSITSSQARIHVFVGSPVDCTLDPEASGVGSDVTFAPAGGVTVTREASNRWKTEVNLPIAVFEAQSVWITSRNNRSTCRLISPQYSVTEPIQFAAHWTVQ
jgi:hypothetical protein